MIVLSILLHVTTVTAGTVAPQLPQIPDRFQVTVEGNIIDGKYTMIAQEFYDMRGNRAALRTFSNNSQQYMIFDYANNQLIYDLSR